MGQNEPDEMPIPLKSAQYFGSNGLKASASSRWIEKPDREVFSRRSSQNRRGQDYCLKVRT